MSNLKEQVLGIVKEIEGGKVEAVEYMEDALDINWLLNNDRTYKGARILVAFGGPNIWIDTSTQTVEGYWWDERFEARYTEDGIGLDGYCEDVWGCV